MLEGVPSYLGSLSANDLSIWAATLAWLAIVLVAVADSVLEFRKSFRAAEWARLVGNGRSVVARRRLRISAWFVAGFGGCLLTGLLAAADISDAFDLRPLLRALLVFAIYAFWRAKRNNRRMREESEDLYEASRNPAGDVNLDTNARVRRVEGIVDEHLEQQAANDRRNADREERQDAADRKREEADERREEQNRRRGE